MMQFDMMGFFSIKLERRVGNTKLLEEDFYEYFWGKHLSTKFYESS